MEIHTQIHLSGLSHSRGAIDADLLARSNTRLLLGALSEMTGFTLLIGSLVLDQIRHAIRRIGAHRGNAHALAAHYDVWLERATAANVARIVTSEELNEHRRQHAIHRWVEHTWETLRGDEDDIEHVSVSLAADAAVVLTGNMTCIDSEALAAHARQAGLAVPAVLKRDQCIELFAHLRGEHRIVRFIEQAVLPNTLGDPDMHAMMIRFARTLRASFPGLQRAILTNLLTHEEYVDIAQRLPPSPMTREVVAEVRTLDI